MSAGEPVVSRLAEMQRAFGLGQFKAVVREKLDGRDAHKVEWYNERSVVGHECMFCPPRKSVVQDKFIIWLDANTKLPLKQVSPNGMVEHYRPIEINPKLDPSK